MKFLLLPLKIDQSQICISLKTSVNEIFIPKEFKTNVFVRNPYSGREVTFQAYESETAHLKLRQ